MKYPQKLFIIIGKKRTHKSLLKNELLFLRIDDTITIGQNPNDPRSSINYRINEVKEYSTEFEIVLERKSDDTKKAKSNKAIKA